MYDFSTSLIVMIQMVGASYCPVKIGSFFYVVQLMFLALETNYL